MWPANLLSPLSVFISLCTIVLVPILYCTVNSLLRKKEEIFVMRKGKQSKQGRRLGFFERFFLTMTNDESNTGYVNTVLLLESKVKLEQDYVKKALLMLLERFPLLRMRVTVDKFRQPWFEKMDNPGQSLDFLSMNQVDATEWQHAFDEQINGASLNTEQGPLWRVALMKEVSEDTGEGILYKNTLLFTFHHVICDVISIIEMKNKLVQFLGLVHHSEAIETRTLSFRASIESLMGHTVTSPSVLQRFMVCCDLTLDRLKVLFGKARPVNPYLLKFPPPRIHMAQKTFAVPRNLTKEETLALIRCSKANKCTVHGALTAAIYLAFSEILEQNTNDSKNPLMSSFTVNIRQECEPRVENEEFGVYFTFDLFEMTVNCSNMGIKDIEPFWEFARSCTRKVHSRLNSGKHRQVLNFVQCVNIPSVLALWRYEALHGLQRLLFNVTNAGSLYVDREGKSPYKFAGSYLATQTAHLTYLFGINIFTVNDRLYWTLEYCPEITSKSQAEHFVDLSLRILNDACAS